MNTIQIFIPIFQIVQILDYENHVIFYQNLKMRRNIIIAFGKNILGAQSIVQNYLRWIWIAISNFINGWFRHIIKRIWNCCWNSFGCSCGFCGLVSIISSLASKKLGKKISKHEATTILAKSKINSIKDLISKALKDEKISDTEFSLIIKEIDKFNELKSEIRAKIT